MIDKLQGKPISLPTTTQGPAEAQKAQGPAPAGNVKELDQVAPHFAHRLLDAARARDVDSVRDLVVRWASAQSDYDAMAKGLLALGNFLRAMGSGEENPKLYADVLSLEPPKDRPFDEGGLALKERELARLGTVMTAISKGHLAGEIDLHAGDAQALRDLVVASSMGLMTDALKIKMVGWNKLTPKLDDAHVCFELGIRKLPSEAPNTNFWVVSGVGKAIEWVKNLRVSPEAVEWMKAHPLFKNYPKAFFDYFTPPTDASGARVPGGRSQFENDIRATKIEAIPDGEIYVGGPIMRVSGPPAVVEFLETNLMRLVTSHTTVATAAAQMTIAAQGKPVAYFGPRRAPGGEDTTEAISKAAAVGGMTVSSDLLAGYLGHTITGTMEHSIMLMLKTVFEHDPPREFTKAEREAGERFLRAAWLATDPSLSKAELDTKVKAQLKDVLLEAHIFKEYAFKYDREKSVALVDTAHPNVGTAAALLAQKMLFDENGDAPENRLSAIRLDSGVLLAQGLRFRRLFRDEGMNHLKILATDGLLPETVKFFEQVEAELRKVEGGKLAPSFYALMAKVPESVAEDEGEKAEIVRMAERLAESGPIGAGEQLFSGYGAGEKIADSVPTVGRPGIVYKASEIVFDNADGEETRVNLAKLASPSKATGPNRELLAKVGADGKIESWVIASPREIEHLPSGYQRLMRTVLENGQIKVNTSHEKAVEHAATRRAALSEGMQGGARPTLLMTEAYKQDWLAVVMETDPSRYDEFKSYFDKMWPTAALD